METGLHFSLSPARYSAKLFNNCRFRVSIWAGIDDDETNKWKKGKTTKKEFPNECHTTSWSIKYEFIQSLSPKHSTACLLSCYRSEAICFAVGTYARAGWINAKKYVWRLVLMRMRDRERANNGCEGTQFGFWKKEKGVKMRKIKWMKNIRSVLFLLPLKTLCDTHRCGPSVGGPWQRYGTKYRFIACNNTPVIIHNKIKTWKEIQPTRARIVV